MLCCCVVFGVYFVFCCVVVLCRVVSSRCLLPFVSWVDFFSFWGCVGSIFGRFGGVWVVFGPSWRPLGASWAALGASWGPMGGLLSFKTQQGPLSILAWVDFGTQNETKKEKGIKIEDKRRRKKKLLKIVLKLTLVPIFCQKNVFVGGFAITIS